MTKTQLLGVLSLMAAALAWFDYLERPSNRSLFRAVAKSIGAAGI